MTSVDSPRTVHGQSAWDGARTSAESRTQTETETETSKTPSSRSAAQTLTSRIRAIDEVDALTRLVATVRPAWDILSIRRAIERDDRAWTVVVDSCWRACGDPDVRHPNGMRFVGGIYEQAVPRLPTPDELRNANRCEHGAVAGACAICRRAS